MVSGAPARHAFSLSNIPGTVTLLAILAALAWTAGSPAGARPVSDAPPDSLSLLEQNLYESNLARVETLLLGLPEDSLIYQLLEDAAALAAIKNWRGGQEILNTILALYETAEAMDGGAERSFVESPAPDSGAIDPNDNFSSSSIFDPAPQFQIESGIDYSRQEFEVTFLENDSVIAEELQNPYLSIAYYRPVFIGGQPLLLNQRLRLDDQFISYDIFLSAEKRTFKRVSRLELDGGYFHARTAQEPDFFDSRAMVFYGNPYDTRNRWYLSLTGRYKGYSEPGSFSGDILSLGLSAYYEHFLDFTNSLSFSWMPNLYRESGESGYRYVQNRLAGVYRLWKNYNRYLELGAEGVYQDFDNVVSEEPYQNGYLAFEPRAELEWAFLSWWGIHLRSRLERRDYRSADAVNPNISYLNLEAIQKIYLGSLKSFGIGYFREQQSHRAANRQDQPIVEQADFISHGLALTGEYLNLAGILLTVEYRLSWRNYPRAENSLLSSFYSDRLVHSLGLFGWIPLSRRWQLQLFANYDNDQDREFEHNDNRNTILNAGVVYKF